MISNVFVIVTPLRSPFHLHVERNVNEIKKFIVSIFVILLMSTPLALPFSLSRSITSVSGSMVIGTGDSHQLVIVGKGDQPVKISENCVDCITNILNLDTGYQNEITIPFILLSDYVFAFKNVRQIKFPYDWPLSQGPPLLVQPYHL